MSCSQTTRSGRGYQTATALPWAGGAGGLRAEGSGFGERASTHQRRALGKTPLPEAVSKPWSRRELVVPGWFPDEETEAQVTGRGRAPAPSQSSLPLCSDPGGLRLPPLPALLCFHPQPVTPGRVSHIGSIKGAWPRTISQVPGPCPFSHATLSNLGSIRSLLCTNPAVAP